MPFLCASASLRLIFHRRFQGNLSFSPVVNEAASAGCNCRNLCEDARPIFSATSVRTAVCLLIIFEFLPKPVTAGTVLPLSVASLLSPWAGPMGATVAEAAP